MSKLSHLYHKSLFNKLFITFISIGFLPYLLFLIYTLILSENKILPSLISKQYKQADVINKNIHNHLLSLSKEVAFLARLDVMDDTLVDDIDKRISHLLSQKKRDYNSHLDFFLLNKSSEIIASSNKDKISQTLVSSQYFKADKGSFFIQQTLYFYADIKASFDLNQSIGTLLLTYDLNNLKTFLHPSDEGLAYLVNPGDKSIIGKSLDFDLNFNKVHNDLSKNDYLIVYQEMGTLMPQWFIVYALKKERALALLYDFTRFMLYLFPLILALIVLISLRYAKQIVRPLQLLTKGTQHVVHSQNYTHHLPLTSDDEIATLTDSFNTLLTTADKALKALELESTHRLERFIHLIEVFNTIIQTKDEQSCIDVSIGQLKKLSNTSSIAFNKQLKDEHQGIILYVNDYEKNEKVYFGAIELEQSLLHDENERKFYRSISKMITLQLEKIRLIQKTQSVSEAKSSFISNMSHELKTPLNAIIGFSQYMISYEELNEEQLDIVSNIESSAQYLLEMIYGILDIAKIEAGKMETYIEELDILSLVKESTSMLEPLVKDKGLSLTVHTQNFTKQPYKSDAKMLKQILLNLLSNAIKFTQEGSISIFVSNSEKLLKIEIKDTGIGLDKSELALLFNDFTQVQNSLQKEHKGTGLGLSLSQKLAFILGGKITLHSEGKNKGLTATLSLEF